MKVGIVDVETTTSNKGNPFDLTNKLVQVGVRNLGEKGVVYTEYDKGLQRHLNSLDLLVGFNFKFDLHWLRRVGINLMHKRVWDCQLGEFLLENQSNPYPSLDQALEKYEYPLKIDVVKTEYWDKGIDTDEIPYEVLAEYLLGDLEKTEQVYNEQVKQFNGEAKGKFALFKMQNLDLLELHEMEFNGVNFIAEKALTDAEKYKDKCEQLLSSLAEFTGGVPINLNSDDDVSCLLYGGIVKEDIRIPVGVFKTGKKKGQVRNKVVTKEYELPRLIKPLEGTGRLKTGDDPDNPRYWLTNEKVIKRLKPNKKGRELLNILKEYTKYQKLCTTYLEGWSKLIEKMNWPENTIHGNLNQCVVITGRLSSTQPNLQNADPITKIYCESRY